MAAHAAFQRGAATGGPSCRAPGSVPPSPCPASHRRRRVQRHRPSLCALWLLSPARRRPSFARSSRPACAAVRRSCVAAVIRRAQAPGPFRPALPSVLEAVHLLASIRRTVHPTLVLGTAVRPRRLQRRRYHRSCAPLALPPPRPRTIARRTLFRQQHAAFSVIRRTLCCSKPFARDRGWPDAVRPPPSSHRGHDVFNSPSAHGILVTRRPRAASGARR
jgi:hypothetical protein